MAKKYNIQRLSQRHIYERRIRCRIFMKNIYQKKKWKNVVTKDEAWVYLSNINKIGSICYHKSEENISLYGCHDLSSLI